MKKLLLALSVLIFISCNNGGQEECKGDDHTPVPYEYRGVIYCTVCGGIIKEQNSMIDNDGFDWSKGKKVNTTHEPH